MANSVDLCVVDWSALANVAVAMVTGVLAWFAYQTSRDSKKFMEEQRKHLEPRLKLTRSLFNGFFDEKETGIILENFGLGPMSDIALGFYIGDKKVTEKEIDDYVGVRAGECLQSCPLMLQLRQAGLISVRAAGNNIRGLGAGDSMPVIWLKKDIYFERSEVHAIFQRLQERRDIHPDTMIRLTNEWLKISEYAFKGVDIKPA